MRKLLLSALAAPAVLLLLAPAAPATRQRSTGVDRAEARIVRCANAARLKNGLDPLRTSRILGKAARFHARNMARLGFFDHTDPQGRGPSDRVAIFDPKHLFTGIGENIAAGYGSTSQACVGWLHSAGHRANILSPGYTYIGGGYATGGPYGRYYVQVFGSRSSAR